MKTVYIKEWKEYSKSKILEKLDNDREAFEQLLKYAIIDKEKDKYQFRYVGVIIINDFVINNLQMSNIFLNNNLACLSLKFFLNKQSNKEIPGTFSKN